MAIERNGRSGRPEADPAPAVEILPQHQQPRFIKEFGRGIRTSMDLARGLRDLMVDVATGAVTVAQSNAIVKNANVFLKSVDMAQKYGQFRKDGAKEMVLVVDEDTPEAAA
jgi:hypothetical protein